MGLKQLVATGHSPKGKNDVETNTLKAGVEVCAKYHENIEVEEINFLEGMGAD